MNERAEVLNRPGRTQRRALRTRQRLMDAALALFSEKGVEACAIEEITERADLGKGTFYRHFTNKEAVLAALTENAVARLIERMRSADRSRGSVEDTLKEMMAAHADFCVKNRDEFLLLFQGRSLLNLQRETTGAIAPALAQYMQEIESELRPFAPNLDAAKVRRLACAMAGFVSAFFSFSLIGMRREEIETSLVPLRQAFVASCSAFLG